MSKSSEGAEDVGTGKRRVASLLSETRGVRKVSAACDWDGVAGANGGRYFFYRGRSRF